MAPALADDTTLARPQTAARLPVFHRVLPATPQAVRQTLVDLHARLSPDVSPDLTGRAELVLAEVLNNIMRHGSGVDLFKAQASGPHRAPTIHLSVTRHARGLACAITDDGVPLPPECLSLARARPLPTAEVDGMPEGGFGWFLIHDLTHALAYFREGTRNLLVFNVPDGTDGAGHPHGQGHPQGASPAPRGAL